MKFFTRIISLFFIFIIPACHAYADLKVVSSIPPLAGMIKKIGAEKVTVTTLLPHSVSAHYYHAKPSDMVKIVEADLVFWIGPNLEYYFAKPFERAIRQGKVIGMMQIPDLTLYPTRKGGKWSHNHAHKDKGTHDHGYEDPHIWLGHDNILKMIDHIAEKLADYDKNNAAEYVARATDFKKELELFYVESKEQFASYQDVPFLVAHDGYQYFEKTYGLNVVGSISISHDQSLSPHRVQEISQLLQQHQAACIFTEPYSKMPFIENLAEEQDIYIGFLDPLGSEIRMNKNYYLLFLTEIRDNFLKCFKHAKGKND